ncbi:hypothetical protein CPLU01_08300 [Colletotrichum plurivorum]|uniref:Rhodopsin domain-containing protein n=1 Tax=Colletotrichum plurivorum TaxID=2175906 RepID=A0A8H6KC49_9PEZI|nr:hypothetical protein CPLU01_08300 [Colletotrichum plurivorum]
MQNETLPCPPEDLPPYSDENRAGLLIGLTTGFLVFALIFVVLRVHVRAVVLKKWGADDTVLVISYTLTVATGAIFLICTRYGLSWHIWSVPVEVQQLGRRLTIAATLGYHLTFITIKIAFLLQYRRVFAVPKFRLFCDIMLAFICCFGTAVVVSSIVMAIPTWNGDTFAMERYNQTAWWTATSAVHLVTDIVIFLMPMPLLGRLNVNKMQKSALMVTFGIGFLTTAISVVRMTTLSKVFTRDVTWDVIPALIWSEVELCCAVVCACIPTLRPLLRVIRKGSGKQSQWEQHTSSEGEGSYPSRRPLKAGPVSSQQSITLATPNSGVFEVEPKMDAGFAVFDPEPGLEPGLEPRLEPESESEPTMGCTEAGLLVRTELSPILTSGGSDDGSDEFGPADEEVATPLSPPPKSYSSPTKMVFSSLPGTPEEPR